MTAIETISKARLPADTKNRDRFVGVRVSRSGPKGFQARFSIPKALLADVGKPERVSIRGTPQNGYIITAGDDFKPIIMENTSVVYLNISVERVNMPRDCNLGPGGDREERAADTAAAAGLDRW